MNNPGDQDEALSRLKKIREGELSSPPPKVFRWGLAWIFFFGYIAVVMGAMYWMSGGDAERQLPRTTCFFFVPPLCFLAIYSHITGSAPAKFMEIDRIKEPGMFWMLVAAFWLMAAGMFVAGLGALLGFWR